MTLEIGTKVAAAAVSALIGVAIGWGANALTLSGRVHAIEQGQLRIELLLHTVLKAAAGVATPIILSPPAHAAK